MNNMKAEAIRVSGEQYMKAAYAYLYIRDFASAVEAFQRAIACDPENPAYYFRASVTAHRSEQLDLARMWAEEAVALDPENALYRQHLDVILASIAFKQGVQAILNGNYDDAKAWLEAAAAHDPLNTEVRTALSKLGSGSSPRLLGTPQNRLDTIYQEEDAQ